MKNELKTPKLTLIGAGPGDADLITVKGLRSCNEALPVMRGTRISGVSCS